MNTDLHELKHRELTKRIIGVFYDVYNELGFGFLESVYHRSLELALRFDGLTVCSPVKVPVWFRGQRVGSFEGDILVGNAVLLELKSARRLDASHQAQLLNYPTDIEIGLLLNFGIKPEFKRLIFDNARKAIREKPVDP